MANATIQITLNGGEMLAGNVLRFDPNGQMQGTVQIVPQENINSKAVYVRLEWHTEGRGDRDGGQVAQIQLGSGQLPANQPIVQGFNFQLPPSPWSFAGYYINIIWTIKVVIDIPFSPDLNAAQVFVLAPKVS
jgi:hypothetical protein